MEPITTNQNQSNTQKGVQNSNEPQFRNETQGNVPSVGGVPDSANATGLRPDPVLERLEAERQERAEIEAGKLYSQRRFNGATCDDKSAKIYARFDENDRSVQPAEFYRFNDNEISTYGYF